VFLCDLAVQRADENPVDKSKRDRMSFPLRLPTHWLNPNPPKGKGPGDRAGGELLMSYTKMDSTRQPSLSSRSMPIRWQPTNP
jgi:hypothetical protein